jgi:hypothetical protein
VRSSSSSKVRNPVSRSTPSIPVAPEEPQIAAFLDKLQHTDPEILVWVRSLLVERESRPTPVEPEARRHYPKDNCGNPEHHAILAAWYARAEAMLDRLAAANAGLELNGIEEERDKLAESRRLAVEPDGLPLDVRSDVQHALEAINAALDKASYGDSVESDLFEAHATLDTLLGGTPSEAKP